MGTSYNCNIATDGLVLCLDAANPRSYPLSGTSWNDLSTSKENASLSNISFDANNKGSFVFDGTNDKISLSNNSNFDLSNGNFTIISWFYISTAGDTTNLYYWIFSLGNSAGQTSGTTFYVRVWRSGLEPGCLFTRINDVALLSTANGNYSYAANNYYKASGRWTHFVFVEDNGTSYYYINGENHASATTPTIPTGTNYITIGDHPIDNPYIGNMAHFSLYQNPLSPDEIRQHFNATRGRYGY
jgi:hypothetical protein